MEDRVYLKDQRGKIGPKGTLQLGPTDKTAIKKCRREGERLSQQKSMNISPPIASTSYVQDDSSHSYSSSEIEDYKQLDGPLQVPYNLTKIPRYALELVRGDISSNLGASLANAFLLDLRAMDLLIPNTDMKNIYMDKCKIDRAKSKVKTNASENHNENVENLLCIGVDGRTDKDTLHYKESVEENGSKILKKAKGPERHLTITKKTPNESIYFWLTGFFLILVQLVPFLRSKWLMFWRNLKVWALLRLSLLTTRIQIQSVKVDLLHY